MLYKLSILTSFNSKSLSLSFKPYSSYNNLLFLYEYLTIIMFSNSFFLSTSNSFFSYMTLSILSYNLFNYSLVL